MMPLVNVKAEDVEDNTISSLTIEEVSRLIDYEAYDYDSLTEFLIIDKANILNKEQRAILYHFNELLFLNMSDSSPEIYIYTEDKLPQFQYIESYSTKIFNEYHFQDA